MLRSWRDPHHIGTILTSPDGCLAEFRVVFATLLAVRDLMGCATQEVDDTS
jgi:hypothetical protein